MAQHEVDGNDGDGNGGEYGDSGGGDGTGDGTGDDAGGRREGLPLEHSELWDPDLLRALPGAPVAARGRGGAAPGGLGGGAAARAAAGAAPEPAGARVARVVRHHAPQLILARSPCRVAHYAAVERRLVDVWRRDGESDA